MKIPGIFEIFSSFFFLMSSSDIGIMTFSRSSCRPWAYWHSSPWEHTPLVMKFAQRVVLKFGLVDEAAETLDSIKDHCLNKSKKLLRNLVSTCRISFLSIIWTLIKTSFCFGCVYNVTFIFLNGPIPASFLFIFVFSHYNFNTNWKKRRWCAWDSKPGPQDGRRRQNHRAMAATQQMSPLFLYNYISTWRF